MAPTDTSSFPAPNVYYRIQSVDRSTYLELFDVDENEVVLRPVKDCLEQQWTFVPSVLNNGTFKVLNAATESLNSPQYLAIDNQSDTPNQTTIVTTDEDSANTWAIREADAKGGYVLYRKGAGARKSFQTFLFVNKSGEVEVIEEKSNLNNKIFKQNWRWKIPEVSPSVPKDIYQIRTLNRTALNMKPGTGAVVVENLERGNQGWEVNPLGNGKTTIKSVSEAAYIGWGAIEDNLPRITKTAIPQIWNMESLGEYTYSISTKYTRPDKTNIVLALTCGDHNEIILKPKKVAHNGIWIFEAVDVSTEDDGPSPPYESVRYPEITEKYHSLKNVGTGQYMSHISGRLYPSNARGAGDTFMVKYTGTGAEFTLSYRVSSDYLVRGGDLLVEVGHAGDKWILERDTDPSGGICYFICAANDPRLVLSGDTRKDASNNDQYTFTKKQKGYTRQQWKFEE